MIVVEVDSVISRSVGRCDGRSVSIGGRSMEVVLAVECVVYMWC